jgi:hypothetical protein
VCPGKWARRAKVIFFSNDVPNVIFPTTNNVSSEDIMRYFRRTFLASVQLTLGSLAAVVPLHSRAAATAFQMAEAMDIPTNSILSASYTHLANPEAANTAFDWGTLVVPQAGMKLAVVSTGKALDANSPGYVAPQPGTSFGGTAVSNPFSGEVTCGGADQATGRDYTELSVTLLVPGNASYFSMQFKFYSADYPESLCTQFNDRFAILLTSTGFTGNIALDGTNAISVNTVQFTLTNSFQLTGTGMETTGAGTDWLTTTRAVVPGETITLKFLIFDSGDGINDSVALMNNFRWLSQPTAQIGRAVEIKWQSLENQWYQVQYASVLDTNNWFNLGSPVVGTGTNNSVFDPVSESARYYRIQLVP